MATKYPTPGEYQEAIQFPESAFSDPILQAAEPEVTTLGLPQAVTGAFAVVFPMRSRGAQWAVKCFLVDVPDQHERYRAIARHLAYADLPYTPEFDYLLNGIRVNGAALPVLRMAWVEGTSIDRFVESVIARGAESDREEEGGKALRALRESWKEMTRRLGEAGVAHGDLQHGNVLVDGDARLRLVDYDAMYVPALRGKRSPEVGHRNYQHPDRDEHDFGSRVDRFSALVIDTAMLAVIHRPELWARYSTGENMLFKAADFLDPDASPLFNELLLGPDELRRQADVLRRACLAEPEDVPSLDDVSSGDVTISRSSRRASPRSRRAGARTSFEHWFAAVASMVAVTAGALFAAGMAMPTAVLLLGGGVAAAGSAAWHHRRMPTVRRRHRLEKEATYYSRLIQSLEDDLDRIEKARADFLDEMDSAYDRRLEEVRDEALRDRLKHHFVGEARAFEGINQKAIVRLKLEGIRTAYHASPERIGDILQLSDETKTRVNLWRAALVSEYEADMPDKLSPAEERRVRRRIEVRLEAMDDELARIRSRLAVQQAAYDEIRGRKDAMDDVSFGRYLKYLLRMGDFDAAKPVG